MDEKLIPHIIEIQQLLARYAVGMTQDDVETVIGVFAPGGTYGAFGDIYELSVFAELVAVAPKGLFMVGPPELNLDIEVGTGTGTQPLLMIDQTNHAMRIGWYSDTYVQTSDGWRLMTRSMTFQRKSGSRDAGRAHDPRRPEGSRKAATEAP